MSTAPLCRMCGSPMSCIKRKISDGCIFRCSRHKNVVMSIRVNSILYEKHIGLSTFVLMVYFWALQIPVIQAALMADITQNTVVTWFQIFRCICSKWIQDNPIRIGGINQVIQVDEMSFANKRVNGKTVSTQWIFGGVDSVSKNCFLVHVRERSKEKLLKCIETYVEPGSKILSADGLDFSDVDSLPVKPGYAHETLSSSSKDFIDPVSGERLWNFNDLCLLLKEKFHKMGGVRLDALDSYLDEYMWRQKRGRNPVDAYNSIFEDIKLFFPM